MVPLSSITKTLRVTWGDILACSVMVGHRDAASIQRHGRASLHDGLRRYHLMSALFDTGPVAPSRLRVAGGTPNLLQHGTLYRDADLSEHAYFSYHLGLTMALLVTQERFGRVFLQHFDAATATTTGTRPDLITPGGPRILVEAKGTRGDNRPAGRHMTTGHKQIGAGKKIVRKNRLTNARRGPYGAVVVAGFTRAADPATGVVGELLLHVHHDLDRPQPPTSTVKAGRQEIHATILARSRTARPETLVAAFGGLADLVAGSALGNGGIVRRVVIGNDRYLVARDVVTDTLIGLETTVLVRTLRALAGFGLLPAGLGEDLEGLAGLDADAYLADVGGTRDTRDQNWVVRGPILLWR